jgi:hypothetical protein
MESAAAGLYNLLKIPDDPLKIPDDPIIEVGCGFTTFFKKNIFLFF